MKLKPVVASLFVLGLMSGSALAAGNAKAVQQAIVDQNSVTSPVCSDNWFNRISIGGIGTVQAVWGNTDYPGSFLTSHHSSDLYVNNFNILANAVLNSWTKATLNLAYIGYPTNTYSPSYNLDSADVDLKRQEVDLHTSTVWHANKVSSNHIIADEAYLTFANFCKTPFYFQVGKKYLPFGTYSDPYNFVLTPMTQVLSQINQAAAIVGFATDFGFYGNAYAFRGNSQPIDAGAGNIRNFGAQLGYFGGLGQFNINDAHYNLNVGVVRAMQDGDYWTAGSMDELYHYSDPMAGLSVHGDLSWNQLDLSANYVTSLKDVNFSGFLPYPGWGSYSISFEGTKIWAADVNADYAFNTWSHHSKVGLSYQFGGNGQFMADAYHWGFPKTRIQADYKVNLLKNVDFDLAVAHNRSYEYHNVITTATETVGDYTWNITNNAGFPTGAESSNVVVGKLSVQF